MRVLFLATRDWFDPGTTGGDMTMWEHARYLASTGHGVTFLASSYPGAPKRERLDGIDVVRLGGIHWQWLTSLAYYMARCRGRFDAVVCEGFGGSRIPRFAPLYVQEPVITEWHQVHRDLFAVQYPKPLNGPLNLLERLTARVHRRTLTRAGTADGKEAFTGLGFERRNIFVLPVSIRDEWLSMTAAAVPGPTIVWLGKLRRYKCPDHLLRAMPEVLRRVPKAKLVLAIRRDDVKYEQELRMVARDLQLGDHVQFRTNVSEDEKRELLRSARTLVVPSAVEGFGIVVLEANACGVPVVASSGVPEGAVRDEWNGLRYAFGDIRALATSVCRMLEDEALHDRLAGNGRAFAREHAWSRIEPQFADILEDLASGRERVLAAKVT